jgi:hypothetical protein
MRTRFVVVLPLLALLICVGCTTEEPPSEMQRLLAKYKTVRLTADLSDLSEEQREAIGLLIEAADEMDKLFWVQAYGSKEALANKLQNDPDAWRFAEINYGPWDRLDDNRPFVEGVQPKRPGANIYAGDATKEEFEAAMAAAEDGGEAFRDPYTCIRRDMEEFQLIPLPYSRCYRGPLLAAQTKLLEAATLVEDPGFKRYLELRSDALMSNNYRPSDMAWMDMKDNRIDVVIGPIENYEDAWYGYKTAFEAYVLIKDMAWSERLAKYVAMLPGLQRGLPVPEEYKRETPGSDSDLNAYDVIYYAGDCNAGSKTIAINLPNDEVVQLEKGTRRLQLKNAMQAKFDHILLPIVEELIAEDQQEYVDFAAFFGNTMFHEVAHGLGIKSTLDGSGTVRASLKDLAGIMEEGKADVLGLYMVTQLDPQGELETSLQSHYVTFLSSIFRSIRFGASSSHGKANMIRFNFFAEHGAFTRDESSGRYRVDMEKMRAATDALSEKILRFQGDGDYEGVRRFIEERAVISEQLQADLDRLDSAGIPVDIIFEQGKEVLGL